jgi:zinc transport system permease protein
MALAAAIIGSGSAVIGLQSAYALDTPAGPSIVCVAAVVFLVTSVLKNLRSV